jgi:hypothetical protein
MTRTCKFGLVPQSFVPVGAFSSSKIILLQIHSRVEDNFRRIAAILGPVELVAGPFGVGVTGEDKGEEVFLHLALYERKKSLAAGQNIWGDSKGEHVQRR